MMDKTDNNIIEDLPKVVITICGCTYQIVNIDGATQAWLIANENKDVRIVSIPESILYNDNRIPVTKIGQQCFEMCQHLQRIDFPSTIKHIDSQCFSCCFDLNALSFPNQLETIGEKCFWGCHKISDLTIPASVRYIDNRAFEGCISLKRIQILGADTKFRHLCFSQCEKLEEISFPNDECMIYESCVYGCENLNEHTRMHIKTREIGKFEAIYRRYESFIEKLSKSIICQRLKSFLKVFLAFLHSGNFLSIVCLTAIILLLLLLMIPILVIALAWLFGVLAFEVLEHHFDFRHENAIAYGIASITIGLMIYIILTIIALFINTDTFNFWYT